MGKEKQVIANAHLTDEKLSSAGFSAFLRIANLWKLNVNEQLTLLGNISKASYHRWKKEKKIKLSKDTLERISYILGIYKALQILLPKESAADAWIRKANDAALFNGKSALDRMLSGNVSDLYEVRRYLDSMRGY